MPLTPEPDAEPTPESSGMMRPLRGRHGAYLSAVGLWRAHAVGRGWRGQRGIDRAAQRREDFIGGLQSAEAGGIRAEIARILKGGRGQGRTGSGYRWSAGFQRRADADHGGTTGTSLPTIGAALIPASDRSRQLLVCRRWRGAAHRRAIYDEVKQRHP